ncbi:MAG: dTDP-4-dehydrorhamnose 3,5-epimerase family protein [Planctomycetia bacterium]
MISQEILLDGLVVKPLKRICNQRGRLMEVQRCDDDVFPGFGQAYITATLPGVVKAWYLHHGQIDQIAPVSGCVKLVLFDVRPNSSTVGELQEIHLDETDPVLVQIPTGVWHGFQAVGGREAVLLHLNTVPFDSDHPDEDRRPIDDPFIPYTW